MDNDVTAGGCQAPRDHPVFAVLKRSFVSWSITIPYNRKWRQGVFREILGFHHRDKSACLVRNAEVSDTEMVLCEELAGRTETSDFFFVRARGVSACAEELGRLKFFKGMSLVIRAYCAVLPADLPVLFRILGNIFGGINHNE